MSPKPEDDDNSRTPAENRFLAECFLAFDDKVGKVTLSLSSLAMKRRENVDKAHQNLQVDLTKVAQSMGHSNEASTGNRFGAMRKKYGFDKKCFHSSNQKVNLFMPCSKKEVFN